MRNTLVSVALATIPLCSGCAVRHAHAAIGQSLIPYQGRALHRANEFRLGFTPQQFPRWAVSIGVNEPNTLDSAAFFAPECYNATPTEVRAEKGAGCHPTIDAFPGGVEVQYRWSPTQSVHPLASVELGRLTTEYTYPIRTTFIGQHVQHDSVQQSTFVTLGGGGEFNLARWLHVSMMAGYRESFGGKTIPNGTVSNSGFTLTSRLIVGQPYRDP